MVRVVRADGSIEDREVQVGVTTRIMAQILAGLAPGETVVVGTRAPDAAAATGPARSALTTNTSRTGGRP
jgi:macrolide-specific efflux system membrane fusion protein